MNDKDNCELAKFAAGRSKHPRIQVGAVITGSGKTFVSCNDPEGHAEHNVIEFGEGDVLYVYPVTPCPMCANEIIRSGIKRVVTFYAPHKAPEQRPEQVATTAELFARAGIEHQIIRDTDD